MFRARSSQNTQHAKSYKIERKKETNNISNYNSYLQPKRKETMKKLTFIFIVLGSFFNIALSFTVSSPYRKTIRPSSTLFKYDSSSCCSRHRNHPGFLLPAVASDTTEKGASDCKLTPEAKELEEMLLNKEKIGKLLVAQTAPSVRVAFSEMYGEEPGVYSPGVLVASLKALGFDVVLDTNTGADLTICEEGTELLHRLLVREEKRKKNNGEQPTFEESMSLEEPLPLFTSCCPGWMNMVSKSTPELIPFISSCKSPHMMLGAMVKQYSHELFGREPSQVYFNSVMPCVRKRGESDHAAFIHDGVRDVDNVITTKDLADLLKLHGINPSELEPLPYDSPFQVEEHRPDGLGSGAGQLFGATGGVMEAAVRTVYEILTESQLPRLELKEVRGLEGIKEATIPLFNKDTGKGLNTELRVAVANGLGNAKKLIASMKGGKTHYDFVEVMACPGGCIGGGGQPKSTDKSILDKRMEVIYKLDKTLPIRRSHENPSIKAFYDKFLESYGSENAHRLLHVKPVYGENPP
jgi:iron-only hydrogenase group A